MSSPPLRIFLNKNEEKELFELSKSKQLNPRTKDRILAVRLSSRGWKVSEIAIFLKWNQSTVRKTLHRWKKQGIMGLYDANRPGRTRKWIPEDIALIESKLEQEQRSYNSRQLCQFLADQRQVKLSERHLRRILKKKSFVGRERENH